MKIIKFTKVTWPEFSNFYETTFVWDGREYHCSEAAFQSAKTLDPYERNKFMSLNGSASKKLGRSVVLRSDWEQVKFDIMVDVLMCKFTQDEHCQQLLLDTGDTYIIENTTRWHDNIWGNCDCERCQNIEGQNLLGKALMLVRTRLRRGVRKYS